MAEGGDVVWMQLATRIPKSLHRQLRLHCIDAERSVMAFVAAAIREKLTQTAGATSKGPRRDPGQRLADPSDARIGVGSRALRTSPAVPR